MLESLRKFFAWKRVTFSDSKEKHVVAAPTRQEKKHFRLRPFLSSTGNSVGVGLETGSRCHCQAMAHRGTFPIFFFMNCQKLHYLVQDWRIVAFFLKTKNTVSTVYIYLHMNAEFHVYIKPVLELGCTINCMKPKGFIPCIFQKT